MPNDLVKKLPKYDKTKQNSWLLKYINAPFSKWFYTPAKGMVERYFFTLCRL